MKRTTRTTHATDWTVIIPLIELSDTLINETLPALGRQDENSFEVLVLPHKKSPKDAALLKKYKWLKIIPTGRSTPPKKRDMAAQLARGTYLAFIDDDAFPTDNWLKMARPYFENPGVYAVCG